MAKDGLAAQHQSDSSSIRSLYDEWAPGYEADLAKWGYVAPSVAADLLASHASTNAQIIDVGCGTGLVGSALAAVGFHDVVGVDGSSVSLDMAAKTGNYRALSEIELTALPSELPEDHFGTGLRRGYDLSARRRRHVSRARSRCGTRRTDRDHPAHRSIRVPVDSSGFR